MNDRFERQRDLVPMPRLADLIVTVIGVGAIGRQVALQLAAIGVRRLQLIDFDRVEPANVTTQGFLAGDVSQLKVATARAAVLAIDPAVAVQVIADRYRAKHTLGEAVFCCVDSISIAHQSGARLSTDANFGSTAECWAKSSASWPPVSMASDGIMPQHFLTKRRLKLDSAQRGARFTRPAWPLV